MYRGRPSWRCPWDRAFQLGQGIVRPISQPRGTIGTASLTLDHTYTPMCAFVVLSTLLLLFLSVTRAILVLLYFLFLYNKGQSYNVTQTERSFII